MEPKEGRLLSRKWGLMDSEWWAWRDGVQVTKPFLFPETRRMLRFSEVTGNGSRSECLGRERIGWGTQGTPFNQVCSSMAWRGPSFANGALRPREGLQLVTVVSGRAGPWTRTRVSGHLLSSWKVTHTLGFGLHFP